MPSGWVKAQRLLRTYLWHQPIWMSERAAQRQLKRACSPSTPNEKTRSGWRKSTSAVRWVISPPLTRGAPRTLDLGMATAGIEEYAAWLGEPVSQRTLDEAQLGWEQARDRLAGIEGKSQTFLQIAGVTTTLVLANGALLHGQDAIAGAPAKVILVALAVASMALITSGVYGLLGAMRTFVRVTPNVPWRVVGRAHLSDEEARTRSTAAVLLSTERMSRIADWKLARLKRATWSLFVAVVLVAAASTALVWAQY
jgi:hypothetical protein